MGRRIRNRSTKSLRTRTAIRVTLTAGLMVSAVLISTGVFIINMSDSKQGHASHPMVFDFAEVWQESSPLLRGSMNQPVLLVGIKISGNGVAPNLYSISFSAGGTTLPVNKQIENARLWQHNGDSAFSTLLQSGATIPRISSENFEFKINSPLSSGWNYFWLTFDVKRDASTNAALVDAECNFIQIGTNKYLPFISSPAGARAIENNIPYYSTGSYSFSFAEAWNNKRDGSGLPPEQGENGRQTFFVQSGHKMECTSAVKLHSLVVESGAMVRINSVIKAAKIEVAENAVLRMDYDADDDFAKQLLLCKGATYIHNNTGKLPALSCRFMPGSSVCFYHLGKNSIPDNITWGNVLIFCSLNSPLDLSEKFNKILGDFEIRKSGMQNYIHFAQGSKMAINGNLIMAGGVFKGSQNGKSEISVGKNFIMKDGYFGDAENNGKGSTKLIVHGDMILEGGIFNFNNCKGGDSEISFSAERNSSSSWSMGNCNAQLCNLNIEEGKELIIKKGFIGAIPHHRTLTVKSGAKLMCGSFPVSGDGGFILEKDATLGIGSIKGINSFVNDGNILTAQRQFNSQANYLYYTASSPQQTGLFNTQPDNKTIKSIIIRKETPGNEVWLSSNLNASEMPIVQMGILKNGNFSVIKIQPGEMKTEAVKKGE